MNILNISGANLKLKCGETVGFRSKISKISQSVTLFESHFSHAQIASLVQNFTLLDLIIVSLYIRAPISRIIPVYLNSKQELRRYTSVLSILRLWIHFINEI